MVWGLSFSKIWDMLNRRLGEPAVVVIDELDKMVVPGRGDELLYYLTFMGASTIDLRLRSRRTRLYQAGRLSRKVNTSHKKR